MIVDESSADVKNGTLARGAARAQLAGTVRLKEWKTEPASPIQGTATLTGADLAELLDLAGQKQIPVRGGLALSARVSGTVESPQAAVDLSLTKGVAYDEPFDRLHATVDYSPQAIHVRQATLTAGTAQFTGSATFEPKTPFSGVPDFRNGRVQFQVASNDMAIQRFETLKKQRPGLTGFAKANFEGDATLHEVAGAKAPEVLLTSFKGNVAAHDLNLDSRPLGNLTAALQTQASVLQVKLDSNFLNSKVSATGEWRLAPGYPGKVTAHFSQISMGAVRAWLGSSAGSKGATFDGSTEGTVTVTGPALDPRAWKATATLPKLEVYPIGLEQQKIAAQRFTFRNQGPVEFTMAKSVITVSSAHFTGPSSDFAVTGTASIQPKLNLDLHVEGGVNLQLLQTFTPDIETAGAVTISAAIRGARTSHWLTDGWR